MKKTTPLTAFVSFLALISLPVFAATPMKYSIKIYDLDQVSLVRVTQNGQPVAGAQVIAHGETIKASQTSENGTATFDNASDSPFYTINIKQSDGSVFSSQRLALMTQY